MSILNTGINQKNLITTNQYIAKTQNTHPTKQTIYKYYISLTLLTKQLSTWEKTSMAPLSQSKLQPDERLSNMLCPIELQ